MDRLPRELVEEILLVFARTATKNDVLIARLVCRDFNRLLRPLGCRTLSLDSTRLSRHSKFARPSADGLQTIGHRCKALHIDMTVLRDDYEVETLTNLLSGIPSLEHFCHALLWRYSFSDAAFTELDFFKAAAEVLFYCRDIDRARICLPFPLVGIQCGVATRVLANAFKALAQRPEEDSAPLTALVVENVADDTLCELWMNPTDVMNMQALLPAVQTLLLGVRRLGADSFSATIFGVALWNMVFNTTNLRSLCLTESNYSKAGDGELEITRLASMDHARWLERRFPGPGTQLLPPKPTHLELKHISILPEDLLHIAIAFGPYLEELHMNNVSLMTRQSEAENTLSDLHLWVGLPNEDPGDRMWIAMRFRALMPKLRICRCANLGYKLFLHTPDPLCEAFDYADPAGLGRSIAQRFVEVVSGIRQPRLPSGAALLYHPHEPEHVDLLHDLTERRARIRIAEHDYHAHKLVAGDATPDYQYSLDGQFRNCSDNSIKELQYISGRVHEGIMAVKAQDGIEGLANFLPDLFQNPP